MREIGVGVGFKSSSIVHSHLNTLVKQESIERKVQITYWAKLGKLALENPDLPIEFIRDLRIAGLGARAF